MFAQSSIDLCEQAAALSANVDFPKPRQWTVLSLTHWRYSCQLSSPTHFSDAHFQADAAESATQVQSSCATDPLSRVNSDSDSAASNTFWP